MIYTHRKREEARKKSLERIEQAMQSWRKVTPGKIRKLQSWAFSCFKLSSTEKERMIEALCTEFIVQVAEFEADIHIASQANTGMDGISVISRDSDFLFIPGIRYFFNTLWSQKLKCTMLHVLEPVAIARRLKCSLTAFQATAIVSPNDYGRIPGYGFKKCLGTLFIIMITLTFIDIIRKYMLETILDCVIAFCSETGTPMSIVASATLTMIELKQELDDDRVGIAGMSQEDIVHRIRSWIEANRKKAMKKNFLRRKEDHFCEASCPNPCPRHLCSSECPSTCKRRGESNVSSHRFRVFRNAILMKLGTVPGVETAPPPRKKRKISIDVAKGRQTTQYIASGRSARKGYTTIEEKNELTEKKETKMMTLKKEK